MSFTLAPTSDAAARRGVKVARFREEKDLKQKLEVRMYTTCSLILYLMLICSFREKYLSQNHDRIQNDDEDVRLLYIAEINLYTHQAFQSLDMISQELSMLVTIRRAPMPPPSSHHRGAAEDERRRQNDANGYSDRLDPDLSQLLKGGPILNKNGRPLQPFTLLDRRSQLQQGVFRPGHNLPTMTIDEYLEEEKRRGGIIEGGGEPAPQEVDEDDMDKADEETMKARDWDEFKEANPRGSGNTLNRG